MDGLTETVAANVRRAREHAELSQAELAGLLGVDRRQVSRWERALHRPEHERVEQIARALGLPDVFWFYGRHEDQGEGVAA